LLLTDNGTHIVASYSFNSFPVAARPAHRGDGQVRHSAYFQFFPSCCEAAEAPHRELPPVFQFFPSCCFGTLGICGASRKPSPFNSFPVAARHGRLSRKLSSSRNFQFFPSCCEGGFVRRERGASEGFQFFPSCCREKSPPRGNWTAEQRSFNSFPVAAELLHALNEFRGEKYLSILSQLLLTGSGCSSSSASRC